MDGTDHCLVKSLGFLVQAGLVHGGFGFLTELRGSLDGIGRQYDLLRLNTVYGMFVSILVHRKATDSIR